MIIAIDGPAAAGKGTLARNLAAHFGLAYLDTGSLYRAVALKMRREGAGWDDEAAAVRAAKSIAAGDLDDPHLRDEGIGEGASRVAQMPNVRAQLVEFQREFAKTPPQGAAGAVLDGRDIGTVVCPDADIKIYVDAASEARAARRQRELAARGEAVEADKILSEMRARDERDSKRAASPLKPAEDAHLLDTTNLDIDAAFAAARAIVDSALSQQ